MAKIILINLVYIFFIFSAEADNRDKTIIKIIDKISGKSSTHEIFVDKLFYYRNINISSKKCIIDQEDNKNYAAFIILKESNKDKHIFKGWLLSKNISISQVSHPVYTIKLIKCL